MNLPYLKVSKRKTMQNIIAFRGVNYGEGVQDGQLEDSRNLTSERFPVMSPRARRSTEVGYENATAVYFKDGRFVVNGDQLLYDGEVIATVTPGKKRFASVNTKVVILPDKLMFDTSTGEVRTLDALYASDAGMVEFIDSKTMAVHQGKFATSVAETGNLGGTGQTSRNKPTLYYTDRIVTHASASINTETGELTVSEGTETAFAKLRSTEKPYIDEQYVQEGVIFSKVVHDGEVLLELDTTKQYGVITKVYKYQYFAPSNGGNQGSIGVPYFGIDYEIREASGESYGAYMSFEDMGFRVGDTIEIEGLTTFPDYNKAYTIRAFSTHSPQEGTEVQTMVFDPDLFPETGVDEGAVTIRRKVPDLTVMCESNNRLWGAEGNTIYASALGDPTNFFTYDGLDTDSYAVAVASEGAFTGCCGFGNSVLFFKEDRLLKVLGDYPSNYTMYEYQVPGVKKGSEGSLCNINETLYYHSREGVYRYTGGSPDLISENFGLRRFQEASAGAEGDRYYISMQDVKSQEWGLWVYDTQRGLWLQEDESQGIDFAYHEGKLYFISGGSLICVNPDESTERIAWSATLCRMDETYLNRKCYSRLVLRADLLEESAWMRVEISCDDGPWQKVYTSEDHRNKTLAIPILPQRCDNFRIRLSGEGKCLVRNLLREFSVNSMI